MGIDNSKATQLLPQKTGNQDKEWEKNGTHFKLGGKKKNL